MVMIRALWDLCLRQVRVIYRHSVPPLAFCPIQILRARALSPPLPLLYFHLFPIFCSPVSIQDEFQSLNFRLTFFFCLPRGGGCICVCVLRAIAQGIIPVSADFLTYQWENPHVWMMMEAILYIVHAMGTFKSSPEQENKLPVGSV